MQALPSGTPFECYIPRLASQAPRCDSGGLMVRVGLTSLSLEALDQNDHQQAVG